jgi:uncharacterized protein YkwD
MRRTLPSLCPLLLALAAGSGLADDKKDRDTPKLELSADEKKILDLTNKERAREKLPELKPDPLLFKLARDHSANMAKQGKLDHVLDGKNPTERARDAGYKGVVGENCAAGLFDDVAEVVEGWMGSKGHRANILRKEFASIGIGIARGEKGEYYYTQVFGAPVR